MCQFISVEVEEFEKADSEGAPSYSYHYVPVVAFTDATGATRRERIVEWNSRAHAEGLVAWLRERLRIVPSREPFQK